MNRDEIIELEKCVSGKFMLTTHKLSKKINADLEVSKKEIVDLLALSNAYTLENSKLKAEFEAEREASAAEISKLKAALEAAEEKISSLTAALNQNSSNSSMPPSSDGLNKPVSLRVKSGRKVGGQKGHKGSGHRVERVDKIVEAVPEVCPVCCTNLKEEPRTSCDVRYSAEIPEVRCETVKYEFDTVVCPNCGTVVSARIPNNMKSTFTYGENIRALAVTLTQYGMMSESKTQKVLSDWLGCNISVGTIHDIIVKCAEKAQPRVLEITGELRESDVLNVDETGVRMDGKQGWFHILSNDKNVLYTASRKRGKEGIEKSGAVSEYTGTLVHDCWASYFSYDNCTHALCCAHVLRELKGIIENDSAQTWCADMTELLIEMKNVKASYQQNEKLEISRYYKTKFHDRYARIVEAAKLKNPRAAGRKQSKAFNLINRLEKYRDEFCRFITDFSVPFDNNQAERDVRPVKVKTKVSGCFRTEDGANNHAAIASVIQTAVKKSKSVLREIKEIITD